VANEREGWRIRKGTEMKINEERGWMCEEKERSGWRKGMGL
jgi:hypothetical protein